MKQSDFSSTLDLAYIAAGKIAQKTSVDKKDLALMAQHALFKAIKCCGNVLPGQPSIPGRTHGSPTEQAMTVNLARKTIESLRNLKGYYEVDGGQDVELSDEFKNYIEEAVGHLSLVIPSFKKEVIVEEEKKEEEKQAPEPEKKKSETDTGSLIDENF